MSDVYLGIGGTGGLMAECDEPERREKLVSNSPSRVAALPEAARISLGMAGNEKYCRASSYKWLIDFEWRRRPSSHSGVKFATRSARYR